MQALDPFSTHQIKKTWKWIVEKSYINCDYVLHFIDIVKCVLLFNMPTCAHLSWNKSSCYLTCWSKHILWDLWDLGILWDLPTNEYRAAAVCTLNSSLLQNSSPTVCTSGPVFAIPAHSYWTQDGNWRQWVFQTSLFCLPSPCSPEQG